MTLISEDYRKAVFERAGGRCEYCRLAQNTQVGTFPVDHIIPRSEGGETALDNLALTCPRCNATKWTHIAGTHPDTDETLPLFNPRTQSWSEHFRWSGTEPVIIEALTDVGQVTVSVLDLNNARHLEVRRWLIALELHPHAEP